MKNTNLIVRISKREKERIKQRAEELDMTMSEYIISLVRAEEAKRAIEKHT